jgi:hypothetical protein
MEILRNPKPPNGGASTMEEAADASASEWQTVQMETDTSDGNTNQSEQTSEDVARRVIERLAAASVTCTSPVAALAVALHARIVLSSQYVCTGVPEAENSPRNGFAAPIRDLPATQFLPANWDANENVVRLRYRPLANPKSGSIILTVQRDTATASSTNAVTVSWEPVSSSSSASSVETKVWTLALDEYINLDSWHVAATRSRSIAPALHYKSLATLLSTFVQTVWMPHETLNAASTTTTTTIESDIGGTTPYIDYTMLSGPPNHTVPSNLRATTTVAAALTQQVLSEHDHQPPRWSPSINPATDPLMISSNRSSGRFPTGMPMQGDFSGDLRPTGLDPSPNMQGGVYHDPSILPGNLMGPNHPMFHGGVGGGGGMGPLGGVGSTGGLLGMHPRFDPFGPPGGPTQTDQQPPLDPDGFVVPGNAPPLRRSPPGGTGNPNNDLQQFPPTLGSSNSGHNLYL